MTNEIIEIHQILSKYSHQRQHPNLNNLAILLKRLNNPHLTLPSIIHVAGTNGKGSVVAYLNKTLQLAGYKVHATTSPHLKQITERIQLANHLISAEEFLGGLQEVISQSEGLSLTYFELITATAFLKFNQFPADYVLLETGLGGRYDATNIIPSPTLSIITSISMDHKEILGKTLSDIALQKAGIIKANAPVLTCSQSSEVEKVITETAKHLKAPLRIIKPTKHLDLSLPGEHQQMNAALAYQALKELHIPEEHILEGLRTTQWPGRLQQVTFQDKEIWLDIAHNLDAVQVILSYLKSIQKDQFDLVFSLKSNRDPTEYLKPFLSHVKSMTYFEQPNYASCHTYQGIESVTENLGIKIQKGKSLKEDIMKCTEPTILITGSVRIVGQFLEEVQTT